MSLSSQKDIEEYDNRMTIDENSTTSSNSSSSSIGISSMSLNRMINDRNRKSKRSRNNNSRSISIKEDCFLCTHGNKFYDSIKLPHVHKLFEILNEGYGHMKKEDLAVSIHLYYKNNIYNRKKNKMLEPYIVYEHLKGFHSLSALNFIVESIEECKEIKFLAKNSLCKQDGTIDPKQFA